jgi:hypothetical protein
VPIAFESLVETDVAGGADVVASPVIVGPETAVVGEDGLVGLGVVLRAAACVAAKTAARTISSAFDSKSRVTTP